MAGVWEKVAAENMVRHVSGTYYLQAKVGGKKIRRSLRTKDLRIAKIKRDAEMGRLRAALPRAGDSVRTRGDALAVVEVREMGKAHLKPRSREYYADLFRILRETLPVSRAVGSVDAVEMAAWWRETTEARSAVQANNLLRFARAAFQVAVRAMLRGDDPTEELRRMRPKKSGAEVMPSRVDFERLVADIRGQRKSRSEAMARFVEFLAWSGCRISEAREVRWEVVGEQWLHVHGGEAGTKNGEARRVPINPRLRAVLERMVASHAPDRPAGPLFVLKSPREALAGACRRLGLRHMRVHDLRHLFATQAIESGVDIPTVARWLGHKDGGALAMRTYGHLRDGHSLAAAERMK
jgi:integrase